MERKTKTLAEGLRLVVEDLKARGVGLRLADGKAEPFALCEGELPAWAKEVVEALAGPLAAHLRGEKPDEGWRQEVECWPPWLREEWEERAAVREFEAGFPRPVAELLAHGDVCQRGEGRPKAPAPETFRGTDADGEEWTWTVDEVFVALDEAFAYLAKVREGERADDTDGIDRLRGVATFEAGPNALQSLVWMVGEACDSEC